MPATMRAYRMTGWEQPPELVEVPGPGARPRPGGGPGGGLRAVPLRPGDDGDARGVRRGPGLGDAVHARPRDQRLDPRRRLGGRRVVGVHRRHRRGGGVAGVVRHLPVLRRRPGERLPERAGGPGLRARRRAGRLPARGPGPRAAPAGGVRPDPRRPAHRCRGDLVPRREAGAPEAARRRDGHRDRGRRPRCLRGADPAGRLRGPDHRHRPRPGPPGAGRWATAPTR